MGTLTGDLEFREVGVDQLPGLELFYSKLVDGRKSFRYFESRDFQVISQHLVTLILYCEHEPVGYGHLDFEDDIVWLGVAIADAHVGKGWGKFMVLELISCAKRLKLKCIRLSVDLDNTKAIGLYQKMNFRVVASNDKCSFLEFEID